MSNYLAQLLILIVLGLHTARGSSEDFDSVLDAFVTDTGLTGATAAVLRDGRLVYAAGKGNIRTHSAVASTLLPVLGISKLITAVAILQLHENGRLQLHDKVFGKHGLLYYMKPRSGRVDARLQQITVRHLLQHTAGWDEEQRPIYDPMVNALLVKKGLQVVNIAKEMELFGIANQDDLIHFMINHRIPHHPGSTMKHSNFGYCVLGRIIEEISGLTYEDYVRLNILEPSGMWKTRVGAQPTQTYQGRKEAKQKKSTRFNTVNDDEVKKGYIPLGDEHIKSLFDSVPPQVLDSTLGWHSTCYDMARFFSMLMKHGDEGLLKPDTLEMLFHPTQPTAGDQNQFDSMAYKVLRNGAYWQSSRNYDIAITQFVFHKPSSSGFPERFAESANRTSNDMTLIFFGVSDVSDARLLSLADEILRPELVSATGNEFLMELTDSHFASHDVVAKYRLSEHKLMAYAEAMRMAGYFPQWLHANTFKQETHFDVIFRKAQKKEDLDFDVRVHGSKEKSKAYIKNAITEGYQVELLQTYKSTAHRGQCAHLTLMTPVQKPMVSIYDVDTDLTEYLTVKEETADEGFVPVVQSIEVINNRLRSSFLLNQLTDDKRQVLKTANRIYHDLHISQLEHVASENAGANYYLSHMDTHTVQGEEHFSAIFLQGERHDWLLQTNVKEDAIKREAHKWGILGYVPRMLVSYVAGNELQYLVKELKRRCLVICRSSYLSGSASRRTDIDGDVSKKVGYSPLWDSLGFHECKQNREIPLQQCQSYNNGGDMKFRE
ncbi:hypothetical protein CAPTEDRAFT_190004 [Capitella teleta]|uniref:Beta-lactamase-related domain-containing protein n=1 Tax=Capitella teleta TaxID=283909 RepID=R7T8V8_CAPTE|nr:hypothetical protein CAPTEDRAFT_190004 [Capitella teleta]|eukprot:ELT87434.1 hypothetical protein CAPTEDRAFT_190004 [Capitella teleta]